MSQKLASSPTSPRRRRDGFTLIEMITVLTIIILVLAIAIPVWNALMGGTNVAAAQNQISATLANARADAIYNRQTMGVCFFIDPKSQRSAMVEVQIQPRWNGTSLSPLYTPIDQGAGDGIVNALELVNTADPSNSSSRSFFRDSILLPVGVGVALNSNTFIYNQAVASNGNLYMAYGHPNRMPPLDRYSRLGCIMFAPDGSLTQIPYAIPLNDQFTSGSPLTENLLCQKIGMAYATGSTNDIAAVQPMTGGFKLPLTSSAALTIFDHDAYSAQHATLTVNVGGTPRTIGSGASFNDLDMNYLLYSQAAPTTPIWETNSDDKFIEENWIDQNGIALMVNPSNGSLIRAK